MLPSEAALIVALVRKEVGSIRLPVDGKDGRDGLDSVAVGPKGDKGDTGDASTVPGPQGEQGPPGIDGRDGNDGLPGRDGHDGLDGRDGLDGANGTGIADLAVDDDSGHLFVELTDGRLIDAGRVAGRDGKDGKNGRTGVSIGGGGTSVGLGGGGGSSASQTFETVSRNLLSFDAVFNYSSGDLVSIDYANGITKTFAYSLDGLESVTLSGSTPSGISLVKTFTYSAGNLAAATYS